MDVAPKSAADNVSPSSVTLGMLKMAIAVSLTRNGVAIKVSLPVQPTTGEATAAHPVV